MHVFERTRIRTEHGRPVVGAYVEVEGNQRTDNTIDAYNIEVERDAAAPAGTVKSVSEIVALTVDGSDTVRAYSALSNTWAEHTLAGASSAQVYPGFTYTLLQTPDVTLAYSADTRSFAEYARTDTFSGVVTAPEAAFVRDGNLVVGFAPALCSFEALPTSGSAALLAAENRFGSYMLAVDGGDVHAFSGVKGTFATMLPGPVTLTLSDTAAFAQGVSDAHVYNALANVWAPSPVGVPASTTLLYNGAVVTDGSEVWGYANRTGTWSALGHAPARHRVLGARYPGRRAERPEEAR